MTKDGKALKVRNEFFDKADFVRVAGFKGGKSDKKNGNMSNSANIGNGIETLNGRFLHREGKQTRKDSFGRCAMRINLLKKLRAIINGLADRVIYIESNISRAAEAVREKLRMIPRAKRMLSGKLFGAFDWADKFMAFSIMRFVKKDASGNHFETGETNRNAFRGERKRRNRSRVSRVAGDDRRSVKLVDDEVKDERGVVSGISDNSASFQIESRRNKFKLGDEKLGIMDIGGFCDFVNRKFRQSVVKNMVAVTPEVRYGFF